MNIKKRLNELRNLIVHQEGTPASIARGIAIGLGVGLILPIGTQTFPALFLAFLLKANKILAWTFTCVTNPVSVVFIYPVQCYIGSLILFHPLNIQDLNNSFTALVASDGLTDVCRNFLALGYDIIVPFFVGGILFAVIAAPLGYFAGYRLVSAYQKQKRRRKQELMTQKQGKID